MSTEPDDADVTAQQRQDMFLTHVVHPRCLPQHLSQHLDKTELQLLHGVVDIVVDSSGIVPTQTIKLFENLRKIHKTIEVNANTISSEINALRPGNSFAMLVRRHRWMFMIHVPPSGDVNAADSQPQEVIVASFPLNLRPSEIYKGNHVDGDIAVSF